MLSPFHRLKLVQDPSRSSSEFAVYAANFTTPDQHGIFNFLVNYKRPFFTNIEEKLTVTVRHMAHEEWDRSYVITASYPWLAGIVATVGGWLLFVLIWLFSAPKNQAPALKKTQ